MKDIPIWEITMCKQQCAVLWKHNRQSPSIISDGVQTLFTIR